MMPNRCHSCSEVAPPKSMFTFAAPCLLDALGHVEVGAFCTASLCLGLYQRLITSGLLLFVLNLKALGNSLAAGERTPNGGAPATWHRSKSPRPGRFSAVALTLGNMLPNEVHS